MITLTTGQPGAGKTLFTIFWVEQKRLKENRPVFYAGITDLTLPWTPIDPEKWTECPDGSIIVIDEAQKLWRPRANGAVVPPYTAALETHRHRGFDIFVITQHPMLIDTNVRRLVGQHFHVVRTFGMHRATVHEWAAVKEQADKSRVDSIQHHFKYPPEVFGWYKSAEIHTHKRRIPARLWIFVVAPIIILACVWGFMRWGQGMINRGAPAKQEAENPLIKSSPARESSGKITKVTAAEWVEQWQPRVTDIPFSAPIYDGVAVPKIAPFPAACVKMKRIGCRCYTQQGTRLDTSADFCASVVERGYFNPFDDGEKQRAEALSRQMQEKARQPAQPVAQAAPAPVPYSAPPSAPEPPVSPPSAPEPARQSTVPLNSPWRK